MSHWFDDAAVELADGSPFTRRTALKRAAVGALATTPLAAIATAANPPAARAGATCADCLTFAAADAQFRAKKCARVGVLSLIPPLTPALGLYYWTCNIGNTAINIGNAFNCYNGPCQSPPPPAGQACFPGFPSISVSSARPASARGGAGGSCQLSQPSEGPPPPPGSPAIDECANCALVAGSKCCFGGPDPQHLCACANAQLPCCERYGCC